MVDLDDGIFTHKFWKNTAERIIRGTSAVAAAQLVGNTTGIVDINWGDIFSLSALTALGILLIALAGSRFGSSSDPSFLK